MNRPILRFIIRWIVCALGIWIAAAILGDRVTYNGEVTVIIISGLILATINAIIKPIVVIFALPAILYTMGLFFIVINGLMLMLVGWLYQPLNISSFGSAMLAGMIIGLVNYLVTAVLDDI